MVIFYNNIYLHTIIMSLVVLFTLFLIRISENKYSARAGYLWLIIVLLFSVLPIRIGLLAFESDYNLNHNVIVNLSREITPSQYVASSSIPISTIITILWLVGVFISLTVRTYRYIRFKQTLAHWWHVNENQMYSNILNKIKKELDIEDCRIDIMNFSYTNTPMLIGITNPKIIIPNDKYDEQEIYYILKHECIHYKKKDIIIRLISIINMSIHWFNPLMYILNKHLVSQCEKACDEQLIKGIEKDDKINYANTIINSIENTIYTHTQLSTQFLNSKEEIKKRLELIFKKRKISNLSVFGLVLIFSVILVSFTSVYAYNRDNSDSKNNTDVEQKIPLEQIKAKALSLVLGGEIISIEKDIEDNKEIYEIEIIDKTFEYSIEIESKSGKVISFEKENLKE